MEIGTQINVDACIVHYSYITDDEPNILVEGKEVFKDYSFIENYDNAVNYLEDLPVIKNVPVFNYRYISFV